jgi:LuxR family transcriptional regulator, maltose regulon positive regulatory protein
VRSASRLENSGDPISLAARRGIVTRPELFKRLAEAERVTEISAPAGSGKTVLLRAWLEDAGLEERAAWVSVHRQERDPQRFWILVADALRDATAGSALVRPLTAAPDLDGWSIVERLLEDLGSLKDRVWLVIDDLHELRSADAQYQLELLVLRAPPELRLVLATRHDLHLGLHRLRLEGELTEIRAADLWFSLDEARALFAAAGAELPETALALVHEQTEGWVAGLRLAALSLAGHPDPERFARQFSGGERTVAEYLLTEVLNRQPKQVRQLLLQTSMLERINGELADLLTGRPGGQRILQELEEANAFVVSLDLQRSSFRYHRLFADLLQLELRSTTAPGEIARLHTAAAEWLAGHGYPVDAIRHAQAAGDWGLASRLLSQHWFRFRHEGQATITQDLLAGFPAEVMADDAELNALMAADQLYRGFPEDAEQFIALATQRLASVPPDRRGHLRLLIAAVRTWLARQRGDLTAATAETEPLLAATAVPDGAHPGLSQDIRAWALINLGMTELWSLQADEAQRHITRGVALARQTGGPYIEVTGLALLALAASLADAARAERLGHQAMELAQQHGWTEEPVTAAAYVALGASLIWRGLLGEAERWLGYADRTLRAGSEPAVRILSYIGHGLTELARDRNRGALAAFRAARELTRLMAPKHPIATEIRAFALLTMVRMGETERAGTALAAMNDTERESGAMRTVHATLRLAEDDPQGAVTALSPMIDSPLPVANPKVWLGQALLLAARARGALGDADTAHRALERALDLAESDGVILWFLIHATPSLLKRHRQRATAHGPLIDHILDLLTGQQAAPPGEPPLLPEPLSESEIRVLRYLPTHLTGPEIAAQLYLSGNTVRTHMRHLYTKLSAHSRAEAVERARALGLLAPPPRKSWLSHGLGDATSPGRV